MHTLIANIAQLMNECRIKTNIPAIQYTTVLVWR